MVCSVLVQRARNLSVDLLQPGGGVRALTTHHEDHRRGGLRGLLLHCLERQVKNKCSGSVTSYPFTGLRIQAPDPFFLAVAYKVPTNFSNFFCLFLAVGTSALVFKKYVIEKSQNSRNHFILIFLLIDGRKGFLIQYMRKCANI
jgi:hypothetical protein